jgi:KaiC/GvpD/RAD55 family RecA-like ATPase
MTTDAPSEAPLPLHGIWRAPWDYLIEHPEPSQRITTGIPALDQASGGGIPVSGLVTLQGSPGAGKTSLAIQIAVRAALGCVGDVWMVMHDEGARGACVRVGQNLGLDRDLVESDDPETMVAYQKKFVGAGNIHTLDPDDPSVSLESVIASIEAAHWAKEDEAASILVLDSTQTAVTGADFDGDRARVSYVMDELKKAARRIPLLVFNISQLNRSAYRHKNPEDNANPLSGGAESRAIEFQSDLLLHLDGDIQTVVTARIVKNRFHRGAKPSWRMRYDVARAAFTEVDVESVELAAQRAKEQERQRTLEQVQDRVLVYLARHMDWASTRRVRESVEGKSADVTLALKRLLNQTPPPSSSVTENATPQSGD